MIGFNATGIRIDAGAEMIQIDANRIGTDLTGTADLGNDDAGISIDGGSNIQVGAGVLPGSGPNQIAFNGGVGVEVRGAGDLWNTVRQSSIHDNQFIGIDLGAPGPDGNDPLDADTGPNDLINWPEIDAANTFFDPVSGLVTVRYRVDAAAIHVHAPGLGVDFYVADAFGSGEGETWFGVDDHLNLGSYETVSFMPDPAANLVGATIVATSTDIDGSTSEFSLPVPVPEPARVAGLCGGLLLLAVLGCRRCRGLGA